MHAGIRRAVRHGILCGLIVWTAGCACDQAAHGPSGAASPFVVSLRAVTPSVMSGETLRFVVTVSNASDRVRCLPLQPIFRLYWTYANGSRDATMSDVPSPYRLAAAQTFDLPPGGVREWPLELPTRHFLAGGRVEVSGVMLLPPAEGAPASYWTGRVSSPRAVVVVHK